MHLAVTHCSTLLAISDCIYGNLDIYLDNSVDIYVEFQLFLFVIY